MENWLAKISSSSDCLCVGGITEGAEFFIIKQILQEQSCIFVARDDKHLSLIKEYLGIFVGDFDILEFPAWDVTPYSRNSPAHDILSLRLKTLHHLSQKNIHKNTVILTTISAITQRTLPQNILKSTGQTVKVNSTISIENLTKLLLKLGYNRTSTVREAGEFAIRGGILDVFPTGEKSGIRIDFFGDDIENIRRFDTTTQRSLKEIKSISFIPATEVLLSEESITHFRQNYRKLASTIEKSDILYQSISNGVSWPGMEHWLPLFYNKLDNILDYCPDFLMILSYQFDDIQKSRMEATQDYYQARLSQQNEKNIDERYVPVPPHNFFESHESWQTLIKERSYIQLSPFKESHNDFNLNSQAIPRFYEIKAAHLPMGARIKAWLKEHKVKHSVIFSKNPNAQTRLMRLLKDTEGPEVSLIEDVADIEHSIQDHTAIMRGRIKHGVIINDTALISDDDILGKSYGSSRKKSQRAEDLIMQASSLNEGDFIVHIEHGVGQYEGLETVTALDAPHDCLKLVYSGGDRLFVPVENLDLLSRYGGDSETVSLDKLGSTAWQTRRAKAKGRINEIATELMAIAAQREVKKGIMMQVSQGAFEEFCSRFGYRETDDQYNAIADVLNDLTSGKVTDRLVCGDVGFGKTEVALRAAFITALSGYQVAIIVPTTLLARQHYQNFVQRFEGFPVNIKQLSRLVSPKEAKQVKEDLKAGKIDIVIGTHALLSNDVQFKRLGLVIVDEEQHFGVSHKEKLKKLRNNVHMLTLTATPIPRTLQMALTGVRDLSIIATPPVDRLAIRTFVQAYDSVTIREAILREKYRGGQSFFVCPRLKDIRKIEEKLKKSLPEIKIGIAHGQMPIKSLEETITAFVNQEFDVLLSTQIVESGIDMPNVNTIIIYRADMFGLSQLYQLRGRVGRSDIRAWAWLITEPKKQISKTALQRLEVMQTLDHLGAGFSVASHDLDQRGAGNLLGEEQSGHIKEVGIELYQKMLEEAVLAAKNKQTNDSNEDNLWSPKINMGIAVMIPEVYVPDLDLRMSIYRKIANVGELQNLEDIASEMQDRFGELPEEVENLLNISAIKIQCKKLNIQQLDVGSKAIVIKFFNNQFKNPTKLLEYIQKQSDKIKIRPDQSILLSEQLNEKQKKLEAVNNILEKLENMLL
ncbi:MAG: transcription-repair coupling factor [Alphaproteobacteria bacterium]